MIKLDPNLYDSIEKDYLGIILPVIKEHYERLKEQKSHQTLGKGKNQITTISLLEDEKGSYSEDKVKRLLTSKITCEDLQDEDIANYLKTVLFVKNHSYGVREQVKQLNIKYTYKQYHEAYYKKHKNPILDSYLVNLPSFLNDLSSKEKSINTLAKIVNVDLENFNNEIMCKNREESLIDYGFIEDGLRHKIMVSTKLDVCPYCNRQYISSYKVDGDEKTTSDLDHFYAKKSAPLFSLSLYNFVPSCQICNSRMKNKKSTEILYPFCEEYDENITFTNNNVPGYGMDIDLSLIVNKEINTIEDEKYVNDPKMFKIEELYKSHEGLLQNITDRYYKFVNVPYKSAIENMLGVSSLSDEEWADLVLGYELDYEKDKNKPFAKVINDLLGK